jgi:hypothetical protein
MCFARPDGMAAREQKWQYAGGQFAYFILSRSIVTGRGRQQVKYSHNFRFGRYSRLHLLTLRLSHADPIQSKSHSPAVENRDPKATSPIALPAAQPKLQVNEHIRRQPMPSLQKARMILETAPARTMHHDHLVRRQIAPHPASIHFVT